MSSMHSHSGMHFFIHCRGPSGCMPWARRVLRRAAVRGRTPEHPPAHPHRQHVQLVSYFLPLQGPPLHLCHLELADRFVQPCPSDQQQLSSGCLHTCTRQDRECCTQFMSTGSTLTCRASQIPRHGAVDAPLCWRQQLQRSHGCSCAGTFGILGHVGFELCHS